jgi:hypothetical protein
VQDVTVQNVYTRGIQVNYDSSFNISNNTINNVQGDYYSIGIFNFGGSGVIVGNTVSNVGDGIAANWSEGMTVSGNDVSNFSGTGIHTDNTGGSDVISGNTIYDGVGGNSYGIFVFAAYEPVTVSGNSITNVQVGLTASGNGWMDAPNTISFSGNTVTATLAGAMVTTDVWWYFSTDVDAMFTNNTITSEQYGFYLESQGSEDGLPGYYSTTCPSGECTLDVLATGNVITTPLAADGIFYAIGSVPYYGVDPDYNGIYNFNDAGNTWQVDLDMDSVLDADDNCPANANAGQADDDLDGIGDACDAFPGDFDNDGVLDGSDNCPSDANASQEDDDTDGIGDACDAFLGDTDNDGVLNTTDNCVATANPGQTDSDHDGVGNACDATPFGDDSEDEDDGPAGPTTGTGPIIPVTGGGTTTFIDPAIDLAGALGDVANNTFPLELVDGEWQFACVLTSVTVLDAANYITVGEQVITVVGQCTYLANGVQQTITLALGEGFAPGAVLNVTITGDGLAAFAASGAPVDAANFIVPASVEQTGTAG